MRFTALTKHVLQARRERRRMEAAGFVYQEGPWQLLRGHSTHLVITDVTVSMSGKGIWLRTGKP